MEGLHVVKSLIQQGDFMMKLNLKDVNWTNEPCITNKDFGCTISLQRSIHYKHSLQAVSQHGQARKVIVPLTSPADKGLEWWVSENSCRLNG